MKKAFLMLIAVAISITTFAEVTWELNNGTLTIGGTGTMPSSWGGSGAPWYSNQNSISTIVIGSGVISVCSEAFYGCNNLGTFTIANGEDALDFSNGGLPSLGTCPLLTTVNFGRNITGRLQFQGKTSITTINITGDKVTRIENSAFSSCTGLTSINLPNTITFIGSSAFSGCISLTSIALPNSIHDIASSTFSNTGLYSIIIPSNINIIHQEAFYGCNSLATVTIVEEENALNFSNGGLQAFGNCPLTTVNFGRNITGRLQFQGKTSITTVNITGDKVTRIEESAFSGCTGLTSINLPNTLTFIGSSAFSGCISLTSIALPNSIHDITSSTFSNTGLHSIIIPSNINIIHQEAFYDCSNLVTVTIADEENALNFSNGGLQAFGNCPLTTVNFGRNITGRLQFQGKTSITTVHITGDKVTRIENSAFSGCTGITTITSENPIPPIAENDCFYGIDKKHCIVNVPEGSRCAYKKASGWKDFENIIDGTTYPCEQGVVGVLENQLLIYPNPTIRELRIESGELIIEDIIIYDVFGKIQKIETVKVKDTIDISNLSTGIYFVKICTTSGEVIKKILKK